MEATNKIRYISGVDFGKESDYTTITLCKIENGVIEVIKSNYFRKAHNEDTFQFRKRVLDLYNQQYKVAYSNIKLFEDE